MAENSKIEWTNHTANFWWGCMKVSPGCKNCYAETLSSRYGKKIWGPQENSLRERKISIWTDILKWDAEAKAKQVRRRVFVSSMSDFLEDHPMVEDWREEAMDLIEKLEWLDVLILTKRPENAGLLLARWYKNFPPHVWMGTSVEDQYRADQRTPKLIDIPAKVHFLSVEPMLSEVNLSFMGDIEWVICGGESGPRCRPFNLEWARSLKQQCRENDTSFFMKQIGGHPYKRDKLTDFPEDLRIREFPNGV